MVIPHSMAFSKKDFLLKARARFAQQQKSFGDTIFTSHSQYKMRQYGLSEQRVRRVIRNPKRREEGIAKETIAVMQPGGTVKRDADGKEKWTSEIWVMYRLKNNESRIRNQEWNEESESNRKNLGSKLKIHNFANRKICIISAWRYPGVSPKRNPIPEDILREIEEGSIFEEE